MAFFDFIKAIRQNDEEEKRRQQQGGVGNRVFGFLDDVLDTAGDVGKKVVGGTAGLAREAIIKPAATAAQSLLDEAQQDSTSAISRTVDDLKALSYEERKTAIKDNDGLRMVLENKGVTDPTDKNLDGMLTERKEEQKENAEGIKPEGRLEQAVLGNEDIQSYQAREEGLEKSGWASPLAMLGTAANVALDSPLSLGVDDVVKQVGKKAMKELGETTTKEGVQALLKGKVADDVLERVSPLIATATDGKEIRKILREAIPRSVKAEVPNPAKFVEGASKIKNRLTGTADEFVDAAQPEATSLAQTAVDTVDESVDSFVDRAKPRIDDVIRPQTKQRSYLETIADSETTTDPLKQGVKEVDPQTYAVKNNPELVARAQARIDTNYDDALRYSKEGTDDEAVATGQLLMAKMQKENRIDDAVDLAENLDNKLRESGRAVQAASIWGRLTPEGILRFATREVGKAREAAAKGGLLKGAKDEGKVVEQLKSQLGGVAPATRDVVNKVLREVAEGQLQFSLGDEVAEGVGIGGKIAKGVEAAALPPAEKKKVDLLVKEVVKKVSQEMLEPKPGAKPVAALDILKETFGRAGELDSAYPYAQKILKDKYGDVPEMSEALTKFFKTPLDMPAASSTVNRAIADQLKAKEQQVSKIILNSWNSQKNTVDEIASSLTKEGFDEGSAKQLAGIVTERLGKQLNEAKLSTLQKMMQEAPKAQQPTIIDKINKLSNLGALDDADYKDLARTKLKLPNLRKETAEKISGLSQQMQGLEDGPDKDRLVQEIMSAIQDDIPVTFGEKLTAYRYQNMLAGPRTQARNIVGNLMQGTVTAPLTKLYQGGQDFVKSALTGKQREAYVNEVPEYYKGMLNAFPEAIEEFKRGWAGGIQNPDLMNAGAYRADKLPKGLTVISRAMAAQDRFFKAIIKNGEFAAQKSKGAADDVAEKEADKFAAEYIFQGKTDAKNETGQGYLLSKFDKATDSVTEFGRKHPSFRWFVPFINIPANITKQMGQYSPAGFATAIGASGAKKDQQMAKAALGTTMTGIGAIMALQGNTTWAPPTNPKEKEAFYSSGKKPYSIRVGDTWVPMIYFGPLGYSLGIPAALKDANDRGEVDDTILDKGIDFAAGQAQFFTQQTYLQGVSNFMDALTGQGNTGDKGKDLASSLGSAAGQLIPLQSLSRFVNSAIDPVIRKKKGAVDTFVSDLPIVGAEYSKNNLEANQNVFTGEEMRRNASDYVAPYSMGKDAANPDDAQFQEGVGEFYKVRGTVSAKKSEAEDYIAKALEEGNREEAMNAALDYNDWVSQQFAPWNDQYGQYASDELQELYDRLKISTKGLSRRQKNIREKQENGTLNYR